MTVPRMTKKRFLKIFSLSLWFYRDQYASTDYYKHALKDQQLLDAWKKTSPKIKEDLAKDASSNWILEYFLNHVAA